MSGVKLISLVALGVIAAGLALVNLRLAVKAYREGQYEWLRHFSATSQTWSAAMVVIAAIITGTLK